MLETRPTWSGAPLRVSEKLCGRRACSASLAGAYLNLSTAGRLRSRGTPFRGAAALRLPFAKRRIGRLNGGPIVAAALSAKGIKYESADVKVARIIGEGSYGQVFEASST